MTAVDNIDLLGKPFKRQIRHQEINETIRVLAKRINEDYKKDRPIFISIQNGSLFFATALIQHIDIACEYTATKLISYDKEGAGEKEIHSIIGLDINIENRHIIILKDVIASAKKMFKILHILSMHNPLSVNIASLLVKPNLSEHNFKINYKGFNISDEFAVGYGLDYKGLGRNLSDIYQEVI